MGFQHANVKCLAAVSTSADGLSVPCGAALMSVNVRTSQSYSGWNVHSRSVGMGSFQSQVIVNS